MLWHLLALGQGAGAGRSPVQGPHACPAREARRHLTAALDGGGGEAHTPQLCDHPVEGAERHSTLWCATCSPPSLSPDMLTVLQKSFGVSLWLRTPEWKGKSLSGGLSVAGERGRGGRSSRRGGDLKGGGSILSLGVAASSAPLLPRPWHEWQPWH